jgi:Tol biopolymer transport system component
VATCDDSNASFAPDGRHLVVQHEWGTVTHGTISDNDQIEHSSIVETNLEGSHPIVLRELDNWSGGFEAPRLTPNNRTLVFRGYTWHPGRLPAYALYAGPRLGGTDLRVTPFGAGGDELSPDGRTLLFGAHSAGELTPGNALYTAGIDGRGLHRIVPASASHYLLMGSFSPDGRSIVFADGTSGSLADVFTLDLATGRRVQVTHTRNLDGWPTWGRG